MHGALRLPRAKMVASSVAVRGAPFRLGIRHGLCLQLHSGGVTFGEGGRSGHHACFVVRFISVFACCGKVRNMVERYLQFRPPFFFGFA
jgi:hypothetical protein